MKIKLITLENHKYNYNTLTSLRKTYENKKQMQILFKILNKNVYHIFYLVIYLQQRKLFLFTVLHRAL